MSDLQHKLQNPTRLLTQQGGGSWKDQEQVLAYIVHDSTRISALEYAAYQQGVAWTQMANRIKQLEAVVQQLLVAPPKMLTAASPSPSPSPQVMADIEELKKAIYDLKMTKAAYPMNELGLLKVNLLKLQSRLDRVKLKYAMNLENIVQTARWVRSEPNAPSPQEYKTERLVQGIQDIMDRDNALTTLNMLAESIRDDDEVTEENKESLLKVIEHLEQWFKDNVRSEDLTASQLIKWKKMLPDWQKAKDEKDEEKMKDLEEEIVKV